MEKLFLGVFFLQIFLPVGVADALVLSETARVSRVDFIQAAVDALTLTSTGARKDVPYKDVPADRADAVKIAHQKGAVSSVFGNNLQPTKVITRGEALRVLQALTGLKGTPTALGYRDVRKGTDDEKAVTLAIEKGWMTADSRTVFGVRKLMTGKEVNALLTRVAGKAPAATPKTTPAAQPQKQPVQIRFSPLSKEQKEVPNKEILDTVWKLINEHYLYTDKIDQKEVANKMAESMVQSLNDPYSTYMRPSSAKSFQNQIQGEVTGIGAQVEDRAGVLTIVSPLRGSPAEKAGLQGGDEILEADGVVLKGMSFENAVDKVRGPKGTSVKLLIKRNGTSFPVTVQRDTVKVPEISITWQGKVAVIQLMQFGNLTDRDLRPAMIKVAEQKPTGIILDLRNNPGGLLHAAEVVTGIFVPKGSKVAQIKSRTEQFTRVTADEPLISKDVPMAVLINSGSASASEIVAGALRDLKRATLVGTKSFGKGTVQELVEFTDGSSLKLTVAEWFTPNGTPINGVGITPDLVVEIGERDEQMRKALEIVNR